MTVEKKSKRQLRREQIQRKQARSRMITIGLIAVGALLIFVPFLIYQLKPVATVVTVDSKSRYMADKNSMGDPAAPIQLTGFSDFQCPYCDRFNSSTLPLLEQYYINTGKVLFTYRSASNFISDKSQAPNTESHDAAAAAYCGMDQGKFWEMQDALFANNRDVENQGSFTSRRLSAIAKAAGLDATQFDDCFSSGKYNDRVTQDGKDATTAGLQGTPFFVVTYTVNGETKTTTIDGAVPFSDFQVKLEGILNEIGAK